MFCLGFLAILSLLQLLKDAESFKEIIGNFVLLLLFGIGLKKIMI